jgi:hypothetical protein
MLRFEWNVSATEAASVQISDALGRTVISESHAHDGNWIGTVDVSLLPAGVYMLSLESGEAKLSRRIVVE